MMQNLVKNKRAIGLLICLPLILIAGSPQLGRVIVGAASHSVTQQQDKDSLFKEFNDKKRSDPKEAYRLAKAYLEKHGKDQDENTKYVKEWVTAYEAVMSRTAAGDSKTHEGATTSPAATDSNAGTNPAKTLDMNGTTWQVKGKENGKPWANIFAFRAGGRFQYERYGADGSSNLLAGTWRQLDESIFVTLLGPDGNPTGTIRAELNGACLKGALTMQGRELQFLMETESAPNGCTEQREAARKIEEGRLEAERKAEEAKRKEEEAKRLELQKIIAAGKSKAASMAKEVKNTLGMDFVLISPGTFMMGSNQSSDEQPVHEVTITQPFYIGKYEVTQVQWQAVMGSNPSDFKKCGKNCPMERVSWNDAQDFISRLNSRNDGYIYRIPTEAEWEYAARAGTTGDYDGNLDSMAWDDSNSDGRTHPVGMKQPNAWGLYDMHGNVSEWCQDWYGQYKAGPDVDPSGPANPGQSRAARGGSWYNDANRLRSAHRDYEPPHARWGSLGLRVVAVR